MNGKKAALVAGLAAIAVIAWIALRGRGDEVATGDGRGGSGSGAADRGSGRGPADPPTSGVDRIRAIPKPIHVGPSGIEPDLEGVPGAPAEPEPIFDAAPHPSLADEFAAEPHDPAWSREHEREIKKRLAALPADGITLEGAECRGHQCRISFTAVDETALGRYVAQLEDSSGLYGYAQMIVLEAITTTPDGRPHERVYARFE